jgi:hypothetical protein
MDEETFALGGHNPAEGGPKGIDIHPQTNVLAVTAERMQLAFFDVDAALQQAESGDVLLQYELDLLMENHAMRAAAAVDPSDLIASRQQIALLRQSVDRLVDENSKLRNIHDSHGRRLTKPLRAVRAGLRHLR